MPRHPFRIFISYSHEDKQLALIASEALTNLGYYSALGHATSIREPPSTTLLKA